MNSFLQKNKKLLAEKMLDLANYVLVGLVFDQLLSDQPIFSALVVGIFICSGIYLGIYYILKL